MTTKTLIAMLTLTLVSLGGCTSVEDINESLFSKNTKSCSAELVIAPNDALPRGHVLLDCEGEKQVWSDPELAETFKDLSRSTAVLCKIGKNSISCDPADGTMRVDTPPAKEVVSCIPIVFDWNKVGCHNAISPEKLPPAEELAEMVNDAVNRIAEEVDEPTEVIDIVDEITHGETPTCLLEDLLCESEPVPLGLG